MIEPHSKRISSCILLYNNNNNIFILSLLFVLLIYLHSILVYCFMFIKIINWTNLKISSHFIANVTWHEALVHEIFALEPPPGVDSTYFYTQLHNWVMWTHGFEGYYYIPARWEYIDSHWNHNPAH